MPQPGEPTVANLGGTSIGQVARRYWLATRPAFLTASIMPVCVGTAWGQAVGGRLQAGVALIALAATAFLHAGANVINDVGDERAGGDRANTGRIFPYTGGSRFIQNGVMSLSQMRQWGTALLVIAVLLGMLLVWLRGTTVVALGLAGIVFGVGYSLPPLRLASRGVGEATIAIGFGILPVMGSAWLQSGVIDLPALLVAVPTSLWVAAVVLINEVPDLHADTLAGKRTLPVRLGIDGTRWIYLSLHTGALLAVVTMILRGQFHWVAVLLPVLLFGVAASATAGIRESTDAAREILRASIEKTLGVHALGSLWVAGCAWFAS